jgi:hypothetical protein
MPPVSTLQTAVSADLSIKRHERRVQAEGEGVPRRSSREPERRRGQLETVLAAAFLSTLALAPANAPLSSVAGVPVTCVDDASWAVSFPGPLLGAMGIYDSTNRSIYLRQVECERLELMSTGARPSSVYYQYDFASSIFLFGHEIAHARGIEDENLAVCAAGRAFLSTASRLGVSRRYARLLTNYLVNARIPSRCYPA